MLRIHGNIVNMGRACNTYLSDLGTHALHAIAVSALVVCELALDRPEQFPLDLHLHRNLDLVENGSEELDKFLDLLPQLAKLTA